ncbi:putative selenate ABC transporter substrate-binding protein [Billgrantia sulfidoxydans]|uniref:Selenate ABC transporter substrate-binding protein n=1 Tax=Billgrantia sulfidoxydans TaxID=2733484 RepID=A0ABX7W867_9GAMM|nr:putative selenate ABC transporter substrate-binding protein [Halomonas sulfidoxydans]QTP55980.1 putative selenate ABC transporter substrate-binding protein [Halomonas sulfidoxydans]
MRRIALTLTLPAIALTLAAPGALAETFRFTAIPDEDEARLVERFAKVADYLEEQLGVEVEYVPVKSYSAAVTAFRNDQVQLAWFGGLSGVQARRLVPGSQALAQGSEDDAFVSYFIAHESTGLERADELPDEIEGMSLTFGSRTSTSGRLMPEHFLRQRFDNADPERFFSRVGYSGDHSRTIALVEAGTYDIGAVNYTVWEAAEEEGRINTDQVRVIWATPPYPDYNWTLRGDADERFGEGFAEKVRAAFLEMDDPELLATFPREAFIPADNELYAPIEEVAEALGLLR